MPQPAAFRARMNPNIAASRPRSRPDRSAPIWRSRPLPGMHSALRPRTGVRGQAGPGDRTRPLAGLHRCGTVPDSPDFRWPDFAGRAAAPGGPGARLRYRPVLAVVKVDQMISFKRRCARLWNADAVHLLPADRSDHRVIDAERICQAIAALDSPEVIQARARQFAVLADPTRLTLLTCIRAAGPISVSDLAAATGINDTTVSQTLRHLRASQTVIAEREGPVVRYRLASTPIAALLAGQLRPGQRRARRD